jgi:hypothetical protein
VPYGLAVALAAGCGGDVDPCADVAGTCVALHVTSSTIDELDQLELDVLYGDRHGTATTQLAGGGTVGLPIATAVTLDLAGAEPVHAGVVAAGKLSGVTLGTGAGSALVVAGDHVAIDLALAAPAACVAGGLYCGGDLVAGDPDTLYRCNAGGAPLARGRCAGGCIVTPADDDACRGVGGACVDGGFYCGGDKVDGDPQTLYRCSAGAGIDPMPCADGCVVAPPGSDDYCR